MDGAAGRIAAAGRGREERIPQLVGAGQAGLVGEPVGCSKRRFIQVDLALEVADPVCEADIEQAAGDGDLDRFARHTLEEERIGPAFEHLRLHLAVAEVEQATQHRQGEHPPAAGRWEGAGDHAGDRGPPQVFSRQTPRIGGKEDDHGVGPQS